MMTLILNLMSCFGLFFGLLAGDGPGEFERLKLSRLAGKTMGTTYHISFVLPKDKQAPEIQQEIDRLLEELDRQMSTYRADSEISRFNRLNSTEPMSISKEFAEVLEEALRICRLTEGRFDITIGPLVSLWGFGTAERRDSVPSKQEISSVLSSIGYSKLKLIPGAPGQISKSDPALQIDLSAIAKGYAVDRVAEWVATISPDYLVEIGGEIRVGGKNPELFEGLRKGSAMSGNVTAKDAPWVLGIEDPANSPMKSERKFLAKARLNSGALATSGDYRNFQMIEGKRYQHTIDPRTGFPVDHQLVSVSVTATDCMTADGLATGLMVYSPDELKEFCQENNLAVLIAYRKGDDVLTWAHRFPGEVLPVAENAVRKEATTPSERKAKNSSSWVTVIATVSIFVLVFIGMSVGVIVSNRQLKGSCGGLSAMADEGVTSPCSLCSKPVSDCPKKAELEGASESPESTNGNP